MAKRIFITATNTDIGKTYTTKLLMRQLSNMGYRIGVCKPIETGVSDLPVDGSELLTLLHKLNPSTRQLTLKDIVPIQFLLPAAPYVANQAETIDLTPIEVSLKKIEAHCDVLLIEGAGGLFVPIDKNTMMIDLIEHFNAKALLVSHCRLGCINDTLLSHHLLQEREIDHLWTLNCHSSDNSFKTISEPYFKDNFPDFTIVERDIGKIVIALLTLFDK